ncbi:esterase-like activity of phytase family protein [Plantactinospora sp. BC1]|uniref:esterase-like activity of phytase family protein n=1 Tax=Plantactinospora sp. BC1 TaxID=2108470 RepID=UPI001F3EFADD|nr:esterase-like activity of phytase family protein [Plantactinospora sp. BC1]
MRRLVILVAAAVLALPAGGAAGEPAAAGQPPGQVAAGARAAAGTPVCTIEDERLPEVSGLAATDDGYVVVNDSSDVDNRRRIFFLDRDCAVTRTVRYPSRPRDTEDLARAPDGTIWVGDIGDNDRVRETVALWKLAPGARSPVLHRVSYPDGAHDAEALLLSGDGTPIIVTKDSGTPGLYAPARGLRAGQTTPLRRVGQFTLPRSSTSNPFSIFGRQLVTGGAVAPDGSRVVLRTYADALEFDVTNGDVVRAVTQGTPRVIPLPDEPQGETVTYGSDGTALLTLSEKAEGESAADPVLLRYPLADREPRPSSSPGAATPAVPDDTRPDRDRAAESSRDLPGRFVGAVALTLLLLVAVGGFAIWRARRRPSGRGR